MDSIQFLHSLNNELRKHYPDMNLSIYVGLYVITGDEENHGVSVKAGYAGLTIRVGYHKVEWTIEPTDKLDEELVNTLVKDSLPLLAHDDSLLPWYKREMESMVDTANHNNDKALADVTEE